MTSLTQRQKNALARHKAKHGRSRKHMDLMKQFMAKGRTFSAAHKMAMRHGK